MIDEPACHCGVTCAYDFARGRYLATCERHRPPGRVVRCSDCGKRFRTRKPGNVRRCAPCRHMHDAPKSGRARPPYRSGA